MSPEMQDEREAVALERIRILRRDAYRCGYRVKREAPCGAPASLIGSRPADDDIVALCGHHATTDYPR